MGANFPPGRPKEIDPLGGQRRHEVRSVGANFPPGRPKAHEVRRSQNSPLGGQRRHEVRSVGAISIMKVTEPEVSQQYTALYQATIQEAVGGAAALMTRLVAHTRATLREQEGHAMELRERDRITDSRRRLNQFESILCERFTEELLTAFSRMASVERALPAASQGLHFDQLAVMDDDQLKQSVATARIHQTVQLAADAALAELNRLICTMLGLAVVRLERNPLRPAVYVEAITAALTHLRVPSVVRQAWISIMSSALGQELDAYYRHLCVHLRERGVGSPGAGGAALAGGDAVPPARQQQAVLTLERLRHLLAGAPSDAGDGVARRYEPQVSASHGESGFANAEQVPTGFRATVPAAFDAIKEMKQLDQVVQRLEARKAAAPAAVDAPQPVREQLRRSAHGLEQTLGVEVVTMMVDNITRDPRLLSPVQQLVAELEPALLQLALVDPRFFSHKQHPARRLLHEITHRSIAFESVDSRGFSGFMEPLREAVAPLSAGAAESDTAQAFDKVLGQLVGLWDDPGGKEKRQLAKAVKALQKAEQRNALSATIATEVCARPDAALVPDAVLDFVCGPWAQVVAHARMSDKSGADDPGLYAQLIEGLMWSAQPHLTRKKAGALTRLVPKLLSRLREGLATIDYPPHKTSGFFEVLMHLHQRGFKPDAEPASAPVTGKPRDAASASARLSHNDGLWVAPLEARASGFIDLSTGLQPLPAQTQLDQLVLGGWVALMAEGSWTRTRLTWASPNGTLFLFADALGYMQSLTRGACERLFAAGHIRAISAHLVEDALNAVAETAMRNSVDVRF